MDLHLKDKVVVVTGASTGIGRAIALEYLAEGCKVVVCARTQANLDTLVEECRGKGYKDIVAMRADVAEPGDHQMLLEKTVAAFGGLNIWVNNAGIAARVDLINATIADWDRSMNINLRATFLGSQAAARYMKEHGGGVIVNASSIVTRIPSAGTGIYAISKWGVSAFTQVMAAEMAPYNIRVFAFAPGLISTEMTQKRINADRKGQESQIALNRTGTPEEIAPAVVMLSSERSGYFTGATIEISGGKFCVQNPHYGWDKLAAEEK